MGDPLKISLVRIIAREEERYQRIIRNVIRGVMRGRGVEVGCSDSIGEGSFVGDWG